ncbi:hypothetical protein QFZ66_005293 [Streptomyces sp. B4I13]|nr:hypothetical protein [Streptomyces sp. B4I13]
MKSVHLADPAGSHEAGDEDRRVGQTELADGHAVPVRELRGQPAVPAAFAVQEGGEEAG